MYTKCSVSNDYVWVARQNGFVIGDEQPTKLVIYWVYVDRLQICSDLLALSSDVVGTKKEIKMNSPDG